MIDQTVNVLVSPSCIIILLVTLNKITARDMIKFRNPFCSALQIARFNYSEVLARKNLFQSLSTLSNPTTITQKKLNKQFIHSNKMFSSGAHPLLDQPAPSNLVLQNQEGELVELKSFIGNGKPSIIFFYPKDESYGCTKEVCSFRDSYSVFSDAGATVVGISSDPVDRHKRFSDTQRLPFPLLSDPNGEARKLYEVPKTLGLLPGRSTYLIDKAGVVRDVFNSMMDFDGHVKKSVDFVKSQVSA